MIALQTYKLKRCASQHAADSRRYPNHSKLKDEWMLKHEWMYLNNCNFLSENIGRAKSCTQSL